MSEDDNAGRRGHKEEKEPILLGIPQSTLLDRLSSGVGVVAEADRQPMRPTTTLSLAERCSAPGTASPPLRAYVVQVSTRTAGGVGH